ncbi:trypsin-like serine peptidase [Agromyces sp. NPDC058126]|uniref:trypsin-like serine peptidase n=1 Tax=Agromyces sp. NPDC058126 TaxID=3346350 RepID=UPI0036DD5EB7
MARATDLIEAIRTSPAIADDALRAAQLGSDAAPVDLRAMTAAARVLGLDPAEFCVERVAAMHLIPVFRDALRVRGASVGVHRASPGHPETNHPAQGHPAPPGHPEPDEPSDRFDPDLRNLFLARAKRMRCRVFVGGRLEGSGFLVGPDLVLTAWHVVRRAIRSGSTDVTDVSVRLADGRVFHVAPHLAYSSECGTAELLQHAPGSDADVAGKHDVVLLRLKERAARSLGYAELPESAPSVTDARSIYLLDFPAGWDRGFGQGRASSIRDLTTRLQHSVKTDGGSSGGACFDSEYTLLGLHQGRYGSKRKDGKWQAGRLVPLSAFYEGIRPAVTTAIRPAALWRLGDGLEHPVVGRDHFIEAVAAAGEPATRVRGVRLKRRDPTTVDDDQTGFGFSARILEELLQRRVGRHVLIRVPLDQLLDDVAVDIAIRARAAGFAVDAGDGLDGATLAARLDAAAGDRTAWVFVDDASRQLTESGRMHLESFVGAALECEHLRLVIAGLETVQFGGLEFSSAGAASGEGSRGLVVDYVGTFSAADVRDYLTAALESVGVEPNPDLIESHAEVALIDRPHVNGAYPTAVLADIAPQLGKVLKLLGGAALRAEGGG